MGYKKNEVLKTAYEKYTIQRPIGAGGSGQVYEVLDSENTAQALKVLEAARSNQTKLKRFKNAGETFYVMPLYSGTLRSLIAAGIEVKAVLPYFGQILDGVEAAHLQKVWHRDIKPENILFSACAGRLVVGDFGIAHFEEEELLTAVETRNGDRLANFLYAAPEQKLRGEAVDSKADIYALGLILNELFSKSVPLGTSFRRIGAIAPEYAYLDELVDLMLRQDPAARPSITEVKRELIKRGNTFLSMQKLSSLTSTVIPESEVDDTLIAHPIDLVSVDFQDGHLIFTLSAAPSPSWITAFRTPNGQWQEFPGMGPHSFGFSGPHATVSLVSHSTAKRQVENMKSYIALANKQYADMTTAAHRQRIDEQRKELRRRAQKEEERQKILRDLNS